MADESRFAHLLEPIRCVRAARLEFAARERAPCSGVTRVSLFLAADRRASTGTWRKTGTLTSRPSSKSTLPSSSTLPSPSTAARLASTLLKVCVAAARDRRLVCTALGLYRAPALLLTPSAARLQPLFSSKARPASTARKLSTSTPFSIRRWMCWPRNASSKSPPSTRCALPTKAPSTKGRASLTRAYFALRYC
jgi:hypothetical protein